MKVASVGDIGIDQYINLEVSKPGGIAFNFAVNVAKAGESASLISIIGDDKEGQQLSNLLTSIDFNSSHVIIRKGETPKQKIILEKTGERKFIGYAEGVLKNWKLCRENLEFIAKHDVVFVPLSDGMEDIFQTISQLKTAAIKITDFSQDYEFADFDKKENVITKHCKHFDVNFIGATEKQVPLLESLSREYPEKVFVLTLGGKGSIGFLHGEKFVEPAKNIKHIVDTTGCGDAFQASFSVNYLKTHNIQLSLQYAAEQAGFVTQYVGSVLFNL